MTSAQPRRPLRQRFILKASACVSALLLVTATAACTPTPTDPETDAAIVEPTAETPEAAELSPEAAAEAEAAQRAEWEAQMKQVRSVIGEMDRETLIGDSATKGPADADVVLIKFSDFECPFCATAAADMKDFTAGHEDDVLYVYKHFPLTQIHPEAMPAAQATWAAKQQDQFWLYHDGLFAYQDKLGEDYYVELAEEIGLDVEQFNRDRNSPEAKAAVEADAQLAQELGLGGTPSFVMTNFKTDLLLPGGAPLELYDEATRRMKADAMS